MEAKELRIGNYTTLSVKERKDLWCCNEISATSDYFEVINIGSDNIVILKLDDENVDFDLLSVEPIPLTEEWLLRLGFYKENKQESKHHSNYFSIGIFDYKYCFAYADFRNDWSVYIEYTDSPFDKDDGKKYCITTGIKHVHQLQNLYFALTGEELAYNI